MDRNRDGRRSVATTVGAVPSVSRRPRVKDASDDEDRMDEALNTHAWERPKKERLATFHVSASINPRNKRKRQGLPKEAHTPGGRLNAPVEDADESVEETEGQVSEDDDEPPPRPPPLLRRPVKARVHAKEDEMVMDIPAVPRKARSSMSASSRYSSIVRRQAEPQLPEVPRQKSVAPSLSPLNGSSSPNFLQKQGRKLKPVGPKVRTMKVPKVTDASTISDQEAEVAVALIDISRSMLSHAGMLESKVEVKLESEARVASPAAGHPLSFGGSMTHVSGVHPTGSTTNGYVPSHLKDPTAPSADAPKRKRPRVVVKAEEGRVSTPVRLVASGAVSSSASPSIQNQSCVGEKEPDFLLEKTPADLTSLLSDSMKVKVAIDAHVNEESKISLHECGGMEQGEFIASKQESQNVVDTGNIPPDSLGEVADATDVMRGNDGSSKGLLDNRPVETLHEAGSTSKLNIDLMASPIKHYAMKEDASGSRIDKQNMGDNSTISLAGYDGQNHVQDQFKQNFVSEGSAMEVARGLPKMKEKLDGAKEEVSENGKQQVHDHMRKEQIASPSVRPEEEKEKESSSKALLGPEEEVSDNVMAPPFVSSTVATVASAPVALAGWMGGLPQLGYYGPGATPWSTGASLPNPGLDVKAAHTATQLPHGPVLSPVPNMKRCATHVFMAHFIYREQQVSRRSVWPAALCRAAPYNLNIPPVNMLDNDKLGGYLDAARKASVPQSGSPYGYTISQGVGQDMAGAGCPGAAGTMPMPNHTSNAGLSGDSGNATGTGAASSNVMAAHAQYIQAMMQQNGFASFPFPFNGPPSQGAQFFNSHFFPPHLIPPPLPHLQPLPQQPGNVLPVQKQLQGVASSPHSNSSQLVLPPIQQQPLQLQHTPQSPSQSHQQHNHVGISAPQFGIRSDKESTAGAETTSTAESRLSAMQRTMSTSQGSSNLPNLNVSASPLLLGTNLPGTLPRDQDGPSGVKQSGKGQQQFQGQSPLSSSMQPQQFATGAAAGLQMKVLDPMLSQGYSVIARGPTNPGPLGLVSSMMGTPGLGVLPGSVDNTKVPGQQQPVYVGHGQHLQRSLTKVPSALDDAYTIKARDYADEKKHSMKPVGGSPLLSRGDMEVSSPSLQGSPTSGSGSNARIASGLGRMLNSATPLDARSSRPAASSGSGQVPLLQNQPQKQAMGRAKSVSGSTNVVTTPAHTVAAYPERMLPGNPGRFPGTGLPYSGQMAPTSQSSKPGHTGASKVGQRMSPGPTQQQIPNTSMAKSHVQQIRGTQPGITSTPPRMLPSVAASAPVLSGGTIPMPTSHTLSMSKASPISTSKSLSNGKGSVSMTKAGLTKRPPVSGPGLSSIVSPGQSMPSRAPTQQKSPAPAAHAPQFPQQQASISAQQQRLATTKNQGYPQMQPQQGQYKQAFQAQSPYRPQTFVQPHQQQYMQQQPPSQQQQAVPQHTQVPGSHHYPLNPQSSSSQHSQASQHLSHLQQQFQMVSSSQPMTGTNGLALSSPNLTLGTAASANPSSSASSDGAGSKANPTKASFASGNTLPSAGMPEMVSSSQSTVPGQASSPQSGSSPYLQPAKPNEQKLHDVTSLEDMASARHLPSPSSPQAVAASNPSPS